MSAGTGLTLAGVIAELLRVVSDLAAEASRRSAQEEVSALRELRLRLELFRGNLGGEALTEGHVGEVDALLAEAGTLRLIAPAASADLGSLIARLTLATNAIGAMIERELASQMASGHYAPSSQPTAAAAPDKMQEDEPTAAYKPDEAPRRQQEQQQHRQEQQQRQQRQQPKQPKQRKQQQQQQQQQRATRYANAALFDYARGGLRDPAAPLEPGCVLLLRLDIGALAAQSHVVSPVPFPDRRLPKNVDLDVMVSSSDFLFGAESGEWLGAGEVAQGGFFLPADGGAAIARGGGRYLHFKLKAPTTPGTAHCRIGYYFRNVLIQSQRVVAGVGQREGFRIETDFTVSDDLTGLAAIPDRPRLSVLTNSNGGGQHQIVLRSIVPGAPEPIGATFCVNEQTIGNSLEKLRGELSDRAPNKRIRTRTELVEDLRRLAVCGWEIYTFLAAQHTHMFQAVYDEPERFVIQVLRPETSGFVLPWSLVYEIPLDSDVRRHEVCPMVREWDPSRPLFEGEPRHCPRGPHRENVLCPFGFWGMRYAIEQLSSTDRPDLEISFPGECVVAETQVQVKPADLQAHVERLRKTLTGAFPGAVVREALDKDRVKEALGRDLPLVYFYCHGERSHIGDPDTWLGVGRGEAITAKDFIGWVVAWQRENKRIWDQVRPLVFINACHSVAIMPKTLISYLDAFVGTAHAAGVIGTEVRVNQDLAMDVGERFFRLFVAEKRSVESALRAIRMEYLRSGNLLGLVYTPYCWADLKVVGGG